MIRSITAVCVSVLVLSVPATAQPSNIDPSHKYCWGENVGFLNWRDANAAGQGVQAHFSYLSGYIWAENEGWIKLGSSAAQPSSDSCFLYPPRAGQTGETFGVSLDGGAAAPGFARLVGYGWGENIGWVNFDTAGPNRDPSEWARYDRTSRRFTGYAWSENRGWINLNSGPGAVFVGTTLCRADVDGNGAIEPADIAMFVNTWLCCLTQQRLAADVDGNGAVEPADIALFVQWWFAALAQGC